MTPGLNKDTRCHIWPWKSPEQTSGSKLNELSTWWLQLAAYIFLRNVYRYIWNSTHYISPKDAYNSLTEISFAKTVTSQQHLKEKSGKKAEE